MKIFTTFKGGPMDGFMTDTGLSNADALPDIVVTGPNQHMYQRESIDEAGETGIVVATYILVTGEEPIELHPVGTSSDLKPDEVELKTTSGGLEVDRCDAYDVITNPVGTRRSRCAGSAVGIVFKDLGPVLIAAQLCQRHFDLCPDHPA